jgi:hypothetical protein
MSWSQGTAVEERTIDSKLVVAFVDTFTRRRPTARPTVRLDVVRLDGVEERVVATGFRVAWTVGGRVVFPALEVGRTASGPARQYRLGVECPGVAAHPADTRFQHPDGRQQVLVRLLPQPDYAFPSFVQSVVRGQVTTAPGSANAGPFELVVDGVSSDTRDRCLTGAPRALANGRRAHSFALGLGDARVAPVSVAVKTTGGDVVRVVQIADADAHPDISI